MIRRIARSIWELASSGPSPSVVRSFVHAFAETRRARISILSSAAFSSSGPGARTSSARTSRSVFASAVDQRGPDHDPRPVHVERPRERGGADRLDLFEQGADGEGNSVEDDNADERHDRRAARLTHVGRAFESWRSDRFAAGGSAPPSDKCNLAAQAPDPSSPCLSAEAQPREHPSAEWARMAPTGSARSERRSAPRSLRFHVGPQRLPGAQARLRDRSEPRAQT